VSPAQLYSSLYFSLFILGIITAAEVAIRFHRPLFLKLLLFTLAFVGSLRSLGFSLIGYGNFNRLVHELPTSILLIALISFYAYVYEQKIKKLILGIALFVAILQVGFALYFTFVMKIPVDKSTYDVYGFNIPLFILRTSILVLLLFTISRLFLSIMRKYDESNMYFMKLRGWSITLFGTFTLLVFINIIKEFGREFALFGEVGVMVAHYIMILLILFRPRFMNRTKLNISLNESFTRKESLDISDDEFHNVFFANVYYLQKNASPEDLCKKLNISSKQLSTYLYVKYNMNYTDLMNRFRIEYFIDLLNSGKFTNYTIDSLAVMSGFNSRHHLYLSFKKFHGGTPSEYMRSLEK
jgi:AraC-like DNA-binding protein